MNGGSLQQALSEEELNELTEFLSTTGPAALNLEALEGFLCALICVPEPVHPLKYLSLICGKGFLFENEDDIDRILCLLVRYWNSVACNLRTILSDWGIFIAKYHRVWRGGHDWARGFMLAALKRRKCWDELMKSEETAQLLQPMLLLGADVIPDPSTRPPPVPPGEQEFMVLQMFRNLTKIYLHFEPLRRSRPSGLQALPHLKRQTRVIFVPVNPCPCGSGSQYQHCCMPSTRTVH